MILDFPDCARRLPIGDPAAAVAQCAGVFGVESAAVAAVDAATDMGAVLMALVLPDDAPPAVLTGVVLDGGFLGTAAGPAAFRDAVEDVGGPDVRETVVLDTALGPAVIAQRVPGAEQVRDRRPLALQLQAFVPAGDRTLLLTLACGSPEGWAAHQLTLCRVVASARVEDDESFENHTYRL